MKVSIIMLTHSAKKYVKISIQTLRRRTNYGGRGGYELIVVDNDSDFRTKHLLSRLYFNGSIDKLVFSKENLMFAKGNNVGSELTSPSSEYILLLNSDVEIRDSAWLTKMVDCLEKSHRNVAAVGLNSCDGIPRCDGFAMLIKKNLYKQYKLDENYEWWWSVTKIQADIRNEGYSVVAVKNYENLLYHFGGRSPKERIATAKGMDISISEIKSWFKCDQKSFIEIDKL